MKKTLIYGIGIILLLIINVGISLAITQGTCVPSTQITNLTIPVSCTSGTTLQIKINTSFTAQSTPVMNYYCYNGTTWRLFGYSGADCRGGGSNQLFEESSTYAGLTNNITITTVNTSLSRTLADDKYYYGLTIYDQAGNSQYYDPNITIDTTPPTIYYMGGTTPDESFVGPAANIFINITANDTNFNSSTIRLYNSAGTLINSTTTNISGVLSINVTNLTNGKYYFNATATDLAGLSTTTSTFNITVITSFQSANYTVTFPYANNAFTNNSILTYGFTTNDPYYNYTMYTLTGLTGTAPTCYQEYANDTSCGNPSVGSYAFGMAYFYINYTKPPTALNTSKWLVRHGGQYTNLIPPDDRYTVDIPTGCWNQTILQLRMFSTTTLLTSYGQCYNGTGWQTITNVKSALAGQWDDTPGVNQTQYLIDGNFGTYACYIPDSLHTTEEVEAGNVSGYWSNTGCTMGSSEGTYYTALLWEEGMVWQLNISANVTSTQKSYTARLADGKYYYGLTIFDKAGNSLFYDPNITIDTIPPSIYFSNNTPTNGSTIDTTLALTINITTSDLYLNKSYIELYSNTTFYYPYWPLNLPPLNFMGPFCYQESANTANQSGIDGTIFPGTPTLSCGLNYSGAYYPDNTTGYIYINYSKPTLNVAAAKWLIERDGMPAELSSKGELYDIPLSCLQGSIVQLRIYSKAGFGTASYGQCYNGTGWMYSIPVLGASTDSTPYANYVSPSEVYDGDWAVYSLGGVRNGMVQWDPNTQSWFTNYGNEQAPWGEEAILWQPNLTTYTFTIPQNGLYYFNATAYDNVPNYNRTETRSITVDYYKNNITFNGYERTTNTTIPFNVYLLGPQDTYNYTLNGGTYTYNNPENAFDGNGGTSASRSYSAITGDSHLGKIFNQSTYVGTIYYNAASDMVDGGSSNTLKGYLEVYDNTTWTSLGEIYSFGPSTSGGSASGTSTYTLNASTYGVRIRATTSASGISARNVYIYELQLNTTYNGKVVYNYSVTNRTLTVNNIAKGVGTYDVLMNTSYGLGEYNTCRTSDWTAQSNYVFPTCTFYNNILNITVYNDYNLAQVQNFTVNLTLGNYSEVQTANTTNIIYYLIKNQTYNMNFTQPKYFDVYRTYTPENNTERLNQSMNQTLITFVFRHAFDNVIITNANITLYDAAANRTYNTTTGIIISDPNAEELKNFTITSSRYVLKNYQVTFNPLNISTINILLYPIINISIFDEKLSAINLTYFNFSSPQYLRYTVYCLDDNGEQTSTITALISNNTIPGSYPVNTTCQFEKVRFDLQYLNIDGTLALYNRVMVFPITYDLFDFKVFLPDLKQGFPILETFLKPYDIAGIYTIESQTQVLVSKLMPSGVELITSDYVDAEGKITVWLIQGDSYILTILADGAPARILGPYSANTEGTKILRLFDVTLGSTDATGQTVSGSVLTSTVVAPVNGEEENHSVVIAHYQDPGNYTALLTMTIYNGSCGTKTGIGCDIASGVGCTILQQTLTYSQLNTSTFDTYATTNLYGSKYMNKSSNQNYCVEYNRTYFSGETVVTTNNIVYDQWMRIPAQFENPWTFPWIIILLLVIIALGLNARTVSFGSLLITGFAMILYSWNWFATGDAAPGVTVGLPITIALLIALFMNIKKTMNNQ